MPTLFCLITCIGLTMSGAILTDKVVGFVGTGKISSCLVGLLSAEMRPSSQGFGFSTQCRQGCCSPKEVSGLVEISIDNDDVVRRSGMIL